MKRPIKIKESDIAKIVKRIIKEERGEGKQIKVKNLSDVKRLLRNPKTMDELLNNYSKLYDCQSHTKGMPTPEEIRRKAELISDTDGDPVVGMMWILFGVFALLMIGLCIDW